MSDFVNFTLFGARYFCISINILELCSGTQLSFMETSWFFLVFTICFVSFATTAVLSRIRYSPHRGRLSPHPTCAAVNWGVRALGLAGEHAVALLIGPGRSSSTAMETPAPPPADLWNSLCRPLLSGSLSCEL